MPKNIAMTNRGAALVEYATVIALISVVVIGAVFAAGDTVKEIFVKSEKTISDANDDLLFAGGKDPNDPVTTPKDDQDDGFDKGAVHVKGEGSTIISDAADTVTPNIFAFSDDGDLLLAFVSHEAPTVTAPAGWALEGRKKAEDKPQYLSVFSKTFVAADGNAASFTQGLTGHMIAQILTLGGEDPKVASFAGRSGQDPDHSGPNYIGAAERTIVIAARTDFFGASPGDTTVSVPQDWKLTTPASAPHNHLGVAYKASDPGSAGKVFSGLNIDDSTGGPHDWAAVVVQVTTGGVASPLTEDFSPYTAFLNPIGFDFLSEGDDVKTLNWDRDGVFARAGADMIYGKDRDTIFIGGKGMDYLEGRTGNDSYVFAAGDGKDRILDGGGNDDRLIFVDIPSTSATFIASGPESAPSLTIKLPGDDEVVIERALLASPWAQHQIETISFSDGVSYDYAQARTKAYEDSKNFFTIYGSDMDDTYVARAGSDPEYVIVDRAGNDTVVFENLTYAESMIWVDDDLGSLVVFKPWTWGTTLDKHFVDADQRFETLLFSDGSTPTMRELLDKAAQDGKIHGTVNGTRHDDNFTYVHGMDGSYTIAGDGRGNDTLTFTNLTKDDVLFRFGANGEEMHIDAPGGNTVTILYQGSSNEATLETIAFSDGLSLNYFLQRIFAHEDSKSLGVVSATGADDIFHHYAGETTSYRIQGNKSGNDSMFWEGISFASVTFAQGMGSDLVVTTADGAVITIEDYLTFAQPWINTMRFDGVVHSREDIHARISLGG